MNRFPTPDEIRGQFPGLAVDAAVMENAGGSQLTRHSIEAVTRHLTEDYAQLGAGYDRSQRATQTVADAHRFSEEFVHAEPGTVALGPSTSQLLANVAYAYRRVIRSGDEIVVSVANHESNIGPWLRLEETVGARVVFWPVDPQHHTVDVRSLSPLLNSRTRLVCIPHVSNLAGHVTDVRAVTRTAHLMGAEVVVDGVAYAPHRPVDVRGLNCDWYVHSVYKTYGPHLAAIYGKPSAWAPLTGPNHFFFPRDAFPTKWELGGVSSESCAGWLGVRDYFAFLAGGEYAGRATVNAAMSRAETLERRLTDRLVGYFSQHSGITVIGPGAGPDRVPTVSFVHRGLASADVAARLQAQGFWVRHGHMYAYRLLESLGIPPDDGVVRVSLLHYNTPAEVERLIAVCEEIL